MSELRLEDWMMPAADLGPENPFPPLQTTRDIHTQTQQEIPGIPAEMLRNMAYGHVPNILPYTIQDGYTRERKPRAFRTAVLENEYLRATFLLEFGGRLWSLLHKPSGRELLDTNPVFQPANLALRNAWFSGGVEWNIGIIGHSPFTCSPLFAAQLHTPDGTPVLRLYEWERIRQVPFQIDAYLPDVSPVLFVRVQILNPHNHEVPMYWWSNIAVPETSHTRVLVPADKAYSFGYGGPGLDVASIPVVDGIDITYTTNISRSADFFFHIPDGQRHWITALDENGRGLIQTSTAQLQGRKLFLWGMGAGGRRWQTFLSQPGQAYIEIQAGLARTQKEHLPMPAGAEWMWLEAYGMMETDPAAVHNQDWSLARQVVADRLEQLIPREALDAEFARSAAFADRPPETILQHGSGWGTLERLRREIAGEPPFCSTALDFDTASLGEAQTPWLALLNDGVLPALDPHIEPRAFIVQKEWRTLLERAISVEENGNWLAWLYLGVMRYQDGERDGARQAWERSQAQTATPWAARNLALLAWEEQRFDDATVLYTAALRLRPDLPQLAIECGRMLLEMERPREWLNLLAELPEGSRTLGRVRLLEGQAALAVGDFARVASLFSESLTIEDLREGERSLSHLWFAYHEQRLSVAENVPIDEGLRARVRREFPVPEAIDFRMSSDTPTV
ncbi:MAG: DUF5107 domain-containing protein [Anaerolineae bacterium]|nr:DUF5107 domain-containing protein [Anaerolineae bacterium]